MATPYRKLFCRIWSDDKFPDLSDDAQLVWFHAYTCEYSTGLGIYKASMEALAADKGWSVERYRKGFDEVSRAGLIRYEARRHVVYFPRFFRWNAPENPNVLHGLLKGLGSVPECSEKDRFVSDLREYAREWGEKYLNVIETLCGTLPERSPNQEQEQEQEQEVIHGTSANADDTQRKDGKPKNARYEYPEEFESLWSEYPRRQGPNNKKQALKAWHARKRAGVDHETMLDGVRRYARHLKATGKDGTEFVMHASTFLGPDERYADEYPDTPPAKANGSTAKPWDGAR